jgi:hypothetical protein
MDRVARVIEAADRDGAVVILGAFYQRQHSHERALSGRPAALHAVANVARQYEPRDRRLQVQPDAAGLEAVREDWKQIVDDRTSTERSHRRAIR